MNRTTIAHLASRRGGKTAAMQQRLRTFLKRNPQAVIVTVRNGETRVEKPVEELPQLTLPKL